MLSDTVLKREMGAKGHRLQDSHSQPAQAFESTWHCIGYTIWPTWCLMHCSRRLRRLSAIMGMAILTICPSAFAEDPDTDRPVRLRPAPDDLSGHIIFSPKLAYTAPFGNAENRFSQSHFINAGPSFGLDLAYGLSRYVALQLRFDYSAFSQDDACPASGNCKATSMAWGAGVDYHIVNGAAFDPWLRIGMGYRTMSFDLRLDDTNEKRKYAGLDWLHLALGGDWYPHHMVGLGPFLALDVGSYNSRPETPAPKTTGSTSTTHLFFSLGIRGTFDPMR